jgi:hypothetical protein
VDDREYDPHRALSRLIEPQLRCAVDTNEIATGRFFWARLN